MLIYQTKNPRYFGDCTNSKRLDWFFEMALVKLLDTLSGDNMHEMSGLFSDININMSSAELAQRVVKVKHTMNLRNFYDTLVIDLLILSIIVVTSPACETASSKFCKRS